MQILIHRVPENWAGNRCIARRPSTLLERGDPKNGSRLLAKGPVLETTVSSTEYIHSLLFKSYAPISSIEGAVGNSGTKLPSGVRSEEARRKDAQQVGEMTCGFETRICYLYVSARIKTIHGNFLVTWQRCDNSCVVCRLFRRSKLTELFIDNGLGLRMRVFERL